VDVKELVSHFESLGDNCEFGVVQRYAGIEPLGFFRWNWTPLEALLGVLDDGFESVDPSRLELYNDRNGEYMVRVPPWGFQYHTHHFEGSIDPEPLREQQIKVTTFLKCKALEDMRSAEKIFVRKGSDTRSNEAALKVFRSLQRYGRNKLLWVVTEDERHVAGTVEVLERGLLRGYIDRFAPVLDAYDCSPIWLDLCRNTYALASTDCPAGTTVSSPRRSTTNLLRYDFVGRETSWWQSSCAESIPAEDSAVLGPLSAFPKRHRLLEDTSPLTGVICGYNVSGLSSGSIYVASAYVCIPSEAHVSEVGMQLRGLPSIMVANADLHQRDVWQRVWISARISTQTDLGRPSLFVVGRAGSTVFSSGWQFEIGATPTPYVSGLMGSMRPAPELRIIVEAA
jgi:hypothetical protein